MIMILIAAVWFTVGLIGFIFWDQPNQFEAGTTMYIVAGAFAGICGPFSFVVGYLLSDD